MAPALLISRHVARDRLQPDLFPRGHPVRYDPSAQEIADTAIACAHTYGVSAYAEDALSPLDFGSAIRHRSKDAGRLRCCANRADLERTAKAGGHALSSSRARCDCRLPLEGSNVLTSQPRRRNIALQLTRVSPTRARWDRS